MKVTLLAVGKTADAYLKEGIAKYAARLPHYTNFAYIETPDPKTTKNSRPDDLRKLEAILLAKHISPGDLVVLLDEHGKEMSSTKFAQYIEKKLVVSTPHIIFIIGGPYGFDVTIKERANDTLSLSQMTFSHQMVRLFAIEQLYRAFTIIKGEPYHHE